MLQLSSAFVNIPVLSLRTGDAIAMAAEPLINPNNLKIEGFYCDDTLEGNELILLCQDIRETVADGFIIDDYERLVEADELVRLQSVLEARFILLGKPVETVSKDKVGKVNDYAVESNTMFIQKLYTARPLLKSLSGGSLSIDRTQIVEVTNKRIVIQDLFETVPAAAAAPIA